MQHMLLESGTLDFLKRIICQPIEDLILFMVCVDKVNGESCLDLYGIMFFWWRRVHCSNVFVLM